MQSVFLPERFEIPNLLSYTDGDLQNVVSIRDVRLKLQGKKLNSLLSTAMTEESPLELVWNVKKKKDATIIPTSLWGESGSHMTITIKRCLDWSSIR